MWLARESAEHHQGNEEPEDSPENSTPISNPFVDTAYSHIFCKHNDTPFVAQRNRVAIARPPMTSAVEIDAREIKNTRKPQIQAQAKAVKLSKP